MTKDLKIVVKAENVQEFWGIHSFMQYHQSNWNKTPVVLFNRLFELMESPEILKEEMLLKEAQDRSIIAIEKLAVLKRDEFFWKRRRLPDSITVIKQNTKSVFSELIHAFLLFKEDNEQVGKDESIAFYYWAIEDFYKKDMEKKSLKSLTKTMQHKIAGILSLASGFKLSSKPNNKLTNGEIFQATRNAVKKYCETYRINQVNENRNG